MSRNSGASGTITIPNKLYSQFAKGILSTYQQMLDKDIDLFNSFLEKFLEENKGKRHASWFKELNNAVYEHFFHQDTLIVKKNQFLTCDAYHIMLMAIPSLMENTKPKLIKKKKIKTTDPTVGLNMGEACVTLDKVAKTINININYNNYSVENTQEIPFFKEVINQLRQVKWTRSSGGEIYFRQEEDEMSFNPFNSARILYHFGT